MNERATLNRSRIHSSRGYEPVITSENEADVVLLNTCSVRDMAEQKALGKMGMLARIAKQRPEVVFGFLGCMAQARGDELLRSLPHVDLVVGTQKFHRVADYVEELIARKNGRARPTGAPILDSNGRPGGASPMDDPRFSICDIDEEAGSQDTIRDHELKSQQATAFVSIMQGCNMHCTFCIVPRTRGAERSRSIAEIVREVEELVARGVKEVTLLGQIVIYGRHKFPAVAAVHDRRNRNTLGPSAVMDRRYKKSPFVQLLEAVHAVDGLERLRFTSPHPIGFRKDLLRALATLPKLAEHVHLPLQSGSDRILKAMHRPYTAAKYSSLVEGIRAARENVAITTDVIVGFPGETDTDYKRTRDLVEGIGFDNAFVFRYSPRHDTPAAQMAGQVPEEIKEERNHDLLEIVDRSARRAGEKLIGQNVEILCEGPSRTNRSRLMGRTRTNKIVVFEGKPGHIGQLLDVHITHATGFSLTGTPIEPPKHAWANR